MEDENDGEKVAHDQQAEERQAVPGAASFNQKERKEDLLRRMEQSEDFRENQITNIAGAGSFSGPALL